MLLKCELLAGTSVFVFFFFSFNLFNTSFPNYILAPRDALDENILFDSFSPEASQKLPRSSEASETKM